MNMLLLFLGFFLLLFIIIFIIQSTKIRKLSAKPKNRVHFYVARDKNGELWLYMGKPVRNYDKFHGYPFRGSIPLIYYPFNKFGLNKDDYANIKWEDEPVEVFLNMEKNYDC